MGYRAIWGIAAIVSQYCEIWATKPEQLPGLFTYDWNLCAYNGEALCLQWKGASKHLHVL